MHRTMQRKNKQQNRITHIINNNNLMWLKWDHPQHHQQQSSRRLDQVVYEDLEGNYNGNEVRSGRGSENKEIGAVQKSVKEAREKQSGSPSNLSNTLGMLFQEERKKVCTFSLCNQRAPPAPVQIAAAESYAPAKKGRFFGKILGEEGIYFLEMVGPGMELGLTRSEISLTCLVGRLLFSSTRLPSHSSPRRI